MTRGPGEGRGVPLPGFGSRALPGPALEFLPHQPVGDLVAGQDRRAGVIVSLVRFDDAGEQRLVVYQMALAELFVPYMDPHPGWSFKSFLDAGEYGLGYLTSPLEPGRDAKQSGFAAAGLPENTNDLAGLDIQADTTQGIHRAVSMADGIQRQTRGYGGRRRPRLAPTHPGLSEATR